MAKACENKKENLQRAKKMILGEEFIWQEVEDDGSAEEKNTPKAKDFRQHSSYHLTHVTKSKGPHHLINVVDIEDVSSEEDNEREEKDDKINDKNKYKYNNKVEQMFVYKNRKKSRSYIREPLAR